MNDEVTSRIAETHSAWVVFLGDRAYKIKKPVKLEFLDFSTPASRRAILQHELELNQRLAPDVYLRVLDVAEPDGTPCEHILVMRRMPDNRRLSALIKDGSALDAEIREIARVLAVFHSRAATSDAISTVGHPLAVRAKIDRDLDEMRVFAGTLLDSSQLERVHDLALRYLDGRSALLNQRVELGYIRDGHGDLLADDIFCLPDGPRILDCLEFDDRLRYGDVLADLAFLMMDLERLGAPILAQRLLRYYEEFTNERHPVSLAHYYIATRALVRSKVSCIRATQDDHDDHRAAASSLLDVACAHLEQAQIRLVLVGGAPGTGKSTLAKKLSELLGWMLLRSDEIRKDLAGVGHATRVSTAFSAGIYDQASTRATYDTLLSRARVALEHGGSAILDASWSRSATRDAAEALSRSTSADLVELRCDASPNTVAQRIEQRLSEGSDASDATIEIATAVGNAFDPWPSAHTVSTDGSLADSLAAALVALPGAASSTDR